MTKQTTSIDTLDKVGLAKLFRQTYIAVGSKFVPIVEIDAISKLLTVTSPYGVCHQGGELYTLDHLGIFQCERGTLKHDGAQYLCNELLVKCGDISKYMTGEVELELCTSHGKVYGLEGNMSMNTESGKLVRSLAQRGRQALNIMSDFSEIVGAVVAYPNITGVEVGANSHSGGFFRILTDDKITTLDDCGDATQMRELFGTATITKEFDYYVMCNEGITIRGYFDETTLWIVDK